MIRLFRFAVVSVLTLCLCACGHTSTPLTQTGTSVHYTNAALGFSLQLPSGWSVPRSDDSAPQFASTEECGNDPSRCSLLSVQDDSKKFAIGPATLFQQLQSSGLQPVQFEDMIPGATVIAANPGVPSHTWFFAYHVFFPSAHKLFLIQSSDSALERTVLSTFSVSK